MGRTKQPSPEAVEKLGAGWVAEEFLTDLDLRDVIDEMARDFIDCDFSDCYYEKYPGS